MSVSTSGPTLATDACAAAAQALAESVRLSVNDPADQVRLLALLATPASAASNTIPTTAPIGASLLIVQLEVLAMCRRSALASYALACADYQPTSYNDAQTLWLASAALFDAEATIAADAGSTDSYLAIRALGTAVVADLVARGGGLPQLVTVVRRRPLPSLAIAYALYQDATRAGELLGGAGIDVPHPAFMPTMFAALAA